MQDRYYKLVVKDLFEYCKRTGRGTPLGSVIRIHGNQLEFLTGIPKSGVEVDLDGSLSYDHKKYVIREISDLELESWRDSWADFERTVRFLRTQGPLREGINRVLEIPKDFK